MNKNLSCLNENANLFAIRNCFLPLSMSFMTYSIKKEVGQDISKIRNKLLSLSDEVWVFGEISDDTLEDIIYARDHSMSVRFVAENKESFRFISEKDATFDKQLHRYDIEDLQKMIR